jgi:aminopeptidase N
MLAAPRPIGSNAWHRARAAWVRAGVIALSLFASAAAPFPAASPDRDMHTAARPDEARVTHVALDLTADFAAHTLGGTATLTMDAAPAASEIVLDTKTLAIERVTDSSGGELRFTLGEADPILGRPLHVALPQDRRRIVIHYRTSPDAAALQWLAPEQTAGKKHPYLFSQGQAILTRTWIPTQDSPGIRQTYSARLVVPRELRAVMSAEQLTPGGKEVPGGRAFEFRMDEPIPPYLIALAVGELAFREVGPRSGVYAEPSVVEAAAYEFADLEKMIEAAESLYGPYRWGRYDILVMPPSFPFGGMENPRLTFATPTVLAGDRSLTSLAAHELAHSWSGNLVTNATWSDFWLNEGFTTYIENRIMEALYGPDRAAMLELIGRQELAEEFKRLEGKPGDTILHIDLSGRDPDDGATVVPYDKGAAFLRMLEDHFGRDRLDRWLRAYFDRHAFTSLTTAQFLADLRTNLLGNDRALEEQLEVHAWIFEPGLPSNAPQPVSKAFTAVEHEVQRFLSGTPARQLATKNWSTQEWQHFLAKLPESLTPAQLAGLDAAFKLSGSGNSEILFAWLRIAIWNHYEPAMPALERFLTSQGRRKFVKPLFEDLVKTSWGRPMAERIFAGAKDGYHSVTANSVEQVLSPR